MEREDICLETTHFFFVNSDVCDMIVTTLEIFERYIMKKGI